MQTKRFQRRKEDFACEHCGANVIGNGYTNHCSQCLWSKHVDVNPGDRAAVCGGMMEPLRVEGSIDDLTLAHRCGVCGYEKRNKVVSGDNINALLPVK